MVQTIFVQRTGFVGGNAMLSMNYGHLTIADYITLILGSAVEAKHARANDKWLAFAYRAHTAPLTLGDWSLWGGAVARPGALRGRARNGR